MLFVEKKIYWSSRQLLSGFLFGANLPKIGYYQVYRWKLWFQIDFTNRKCFFNKAVLSSHQHWNVFSTSWDSSSSIDTEILSTLDLRWSCLSSRSILSIISLLHYDQTMYLAGGHPRAEMRFWKFQSETSLCYIYFSLGKWGLTYDDQFKNHCNIRIILNKRNLD